MIVICLIEQELAGQVTNYRLHFNLLLPIGIILIWEKDTRERSGKNGSEGGLGDKDMEREREL